MTEQDEKLTRYLTELAASNPQQIPAALIQIMQYRILQMLLGNFQDALETCIVQLEKQLKK